MTIRRSVCSSATGGRRSKKCFWISRAGAAKRGRRRNERTDRNLFGVLVSTHRRDGAALLLSDAFVLATAARTDLLADGPDADVGLPAILRRPECEFLCARRRHIHWC